MYEVFEHTADLGLRMRAADLGSLFAEAGRALFTVIADNLDDVQPVHERRFSIAGDNIEYLLRDWLGELLYTFDAEQFLFSKFDVDVRDDRLEAVARGEPVDRARHRIEREVKAITYHGLKVEKNENGWLAEVILDI